MFASLSLCDVYLIVPMEMGIQVNATPGVDYSQGGHRQHILSQGVEREYKASEPASIQPKEAGSAWL